MKLAYWMYAGPAHIGTLRVASSFKNVYAIMHMHIINKLIVFNNKSYIYDRIN